LVSLRSFSRDLLQQLLGNGLIDQAFTVSVDPLISNDSTPRLQTEALDVGQDLEVSIFSSPIIFISDQGSIQLYLDSKLTPETSLDDARASLQRVWRDAGSHATFAEVVRKVWTSVVIIRIGVDDLSSVF
jgi:mediator of RNA polymerase II transcription subunit 5